jgi:hypothetical protein
MHLPKQLMFNQGQYSSRHLIFLHRYMILNIIPVTKAGFELGRIYFTMQAFPEIIRYPAAFAIYKVLPLHITDTILVMG